MLYNILSRILDIIVSIVALVLASPVLIVISILIKLESPEGPVFIDVGERIGKDGVPFKMLKFRSMIPNAHIVIQTDPKYKDLYKKWREGQGKLKIDEDPRILKIGKFIRKTDLDEFAQFFNVLAGNMSVVGPRANYQNDYDEWLVKYPEIKADVEKVLKVKPGITGIWQISGRNSITIPQRFKMDADFYSSRSIIKDILVIIKTPIVMITRKGANE